MELINSLVERSKASISKNRRDDFLKISITIEEFIRKEKLPINKYYEENTFFTQVVYVGFKYYDVKKRIKASLLEEVFQKYGVELEMYDFVINYITEIKYKNYPLLRIIKVDYESGPATNNKLDIDSIEVKSRFHDEKIFAVHPKYHLEEIYRKLYSPEYHQEWPELEEERKQIVLDWQVHGGSERKKRRHMKKRVKYILRGLCHFADYDGETLIGVGGVADIQPIKDILDREYEGLFIKKQRSKSLFDPRIKAVVYRIDKSAVFKLWLLADHELIPVIKENVHIDVMLRLCLNEYIASDMIGIAAMSAVKLEIFKRLLEKRESLIESKMLADPGSCKYIGEYYPMPTSLKLMKLQRLKAARERAEKKREFEKNNIQRE
jgi:hypothetical protein